MSSAVQPIVNAVSAVTSDVTSQPVWHMQLAQAKREEVRYVAVEQLSLHPATNFLVSHRRSYEAVRDSMHREGVLFPLAVATDGRVLDGRYRLQAAKELGIESVPVLTVDLPAGVNAAADWVFAMKGSREHLTDEERAVLAVEYQRLIKAENTKVRTARMNESRAEKKTTKMIPATKNEPQQASRKKRDSRREACDEFGISQRLFNATSRLKEDRPDLYQKVTQGDMKLRDAIKKKGKNVDAARIETALAAAVRREDLADEQIENRIHCGEAAEMLRRVKEDVASLVLFSPPYYGVYNEEYQPALPTVTYPEYLEGLRNVLAESYRVSRHGGRLAIVLDDVQNPEAGGDCDEAIPVVADVIKLAQSCGWRYWLPIPWMKGEVTGSSKTIFGSYGLCSAPSLGRAYESILVFFKGQKKLEGDQQLSDLRREEHMAWWKTPWEIQPETRKSILSVHPASFPEELPQRLIKLLTYRRDLVIDPFNGSGTTTCVASRLGRRFIGIDRSPRYCVFAKTRLEKQAEPDSNAA